MLETCDFDIALVASVVQLCLTAFSIFVPTFISLVIGKCCLILRFVGQSQYMICIVSESY